MDNVAKDLLSTARDLYWQEKAAPKKSPDKVILRLRKEQAADQFIDRMGWLAESGASSEVR